MNKTRSKVISDFTGIAWQPPPVEGELLLNDGSRQRVDLPTAQDLQAMQQAAYEEGFRIGREDGNRVGNEEARASYAEQTQCFERLVGGLAEPFAELDDAVVQSVADLAILIARHLVRRELKTEPGEIVAVVREALGCLPAATRNPSLRVNPEDLDIVNQALGVDGGERAWRLEADPLISRGGCTVETDSSFVDATIEARIAAIASQMLGGEREGDRDT